MNRREWLKILAGGAAGAAMIGWPQGTKAGAINSYFVITNRPRGTVDRILRLTHQTRRHVQVTMRRVSPVRQDLAVICDGVVIDPADGHRISEELSRFASELRCETSLGTHMVSIETPATEPEQVRFECNGSLIESIDPSASYEHISVAGVTGDTVFSLKDRTLSVVSSSCRHELCKASGPIRNGRIICAPNRLVATIGNPQSAVDVITG